MISARPIRPPKAVSRRRLRSEPDPKAVNVCPMKAPTAIAAASPPTTDVRSGTEENATGSTARMLPAKCARVARALKILCA